MKVFISWSGDTSKGVAELFEKWLPDVLQCVQCWISTKDIDKGSIWFGELFQKVGELNLGISCVARDNLTAPWLLWELGALSKGLTKSRVCPFLINLEPKELVPPWQQYNATRATQEDVLTLIKTINDSNPKEALEPDRLSAAFRRCWPEFDQKFKEIVSRAPQTEPRPLKTEEILTELLQLSRSIHAASQENRALSSLATQIISGRHSPRPDFPSCQDLHQRAERRRTVAGGPTGCGVAKSKKGAGVSVQRPRSTALQSEGVTSVLHYSLPRNRHRPSRRRAVASTRRYHFNLQGLRETCLQGPRFEHGRKAPVA